MLAMPRDRSSLFFDTVVLSNFAFAEGGILLLKKRYQGRGMITLQVIEELKKATFSSYEQLEHLENQLMTDGGFQKISLNENEQARYLIFLRHFGAGEASCLAAAIHRNGVVVTDDRMARNTCKENHVPVTGTIGILKAAHQEGVFDMETVNRMLHEMIKKGFYSPVNYISDIV